MRQSHSNKEPIWPMERNLARYDEMAGFDIQEHLRKGGLWIDIGVGRSAKPMQPLIGRRGIVLKAISPHERNLPPGISLTTGSVPEDTGFLEQNRDRARLVTDIFGAVSYGDDPILALIYAGLLLRKDGIFIAFTELHRLGNIETWDRATEFFHKRMKQDISFETDYVRGDSTKRFETYLRIRITGKSAQKAGFSTIVKDAQDWLGKPRRGKPLWVSPDKSAAIVRAHYGAVG